MVSSNPSNEKSSNAKTSTRPRIFEPVWKDGECTLVLNESISKKDRRALECNLPECLNEKRLLTKEEIEASGYIENVADTMYWLKVPSGRVPGVIRLSTTWLKEHGFLDRLIALRELSLKPSYVKNLYEGELNRESKNQTRFPLGSTMLIHNGYNSIRLSAISARNHNGESNKVTVELTDIVSKVTKLVVPTEFSRRQEERALQNASLLIGARDNHAYTSIQLNYTKQGTKLTDGLGVRGSIHRDIKNDPTCLTAIIALSNLTEDYFGGRFNITSLNMTLPVSSFEIVLFPGRLFHCASGIGPYSVPVGHPLRAPTLDPTLIPPLSHTLTPMRFNAVVYPGKLQMQPSLRMVNPIFYGPEGTKVFQDKAQHYEWMMRFFIRHEKEIRARIGGKNLNSGSDCGPKALAKAFRQCVAFENYSRVNEAAAKTKAKHQTPEYYRQLFEYKDENGEWVTPSLEAVFRMIHSLQEKNTDIEVLKKDMKWIEGGGNKNSHQKRVDSAEDTSDIDDDSKNLDPASFKPLLEKLTILSTQPSKREEFDAALDSVVTTATTSYLAPSKSKKRSRSSGNSKSNIYMPPKKRAKQKSKTAASKTGTAYSGTSSTESVAEKQVQRKTTRNISSARYTSTDSDSDLEADEIISLHSDQDSPTSNISDNEGEWEIERLVARRRTKSGKLIYQARWKDWGPEWDEWKTVSQLRYAQELIQEYDAKAAKWENQAYGDHQYFTPEILDE